MSIGKALSEARERSGLTTAQVSEATRIRSTLIAQIEGDDFSHCGGDVYARGHIRSIARVVGIDPAPLVAEYDQAHPGDAVPVASEALAPERPSRPPLPVPAERVGGPNWSRAMAVALGVIVLVFVITQLVPRGSSHPGAINAPAKPATSGSPAARPTPPTSTPSTSPSSGLLARIPSNSVDVKIIADNGNSWVRATGSDGKQLYEGTITAGQTQDLTDERVVRLIIGNAGAVRLVVNGKDLGVQGQQGAVARPQFSRGDPQAG